MSLQLNQLITGGPSEFGIQVQHVNGEGNLVNDALSWAVAAGEKLKVAQIIVRAIPVAMVDRLFGRQVAAKVSGHVETVLKDRVLLPRDERRDVDVNVSVPRLRVAGNLTIFEPLQGEHLAVIVLALLVAVFLLRIELGSPHGIVLAAGVLLAAGETVKHLTGFVRYTTGQAGAGARAVHRLSVVLRLIIGKYAGKHEKWLSALLAREFDPLNLRNHGNLLFVGGTSDSDIAMARCQVLGDK